jgi:MFS family permease
MSTPYGRWWEACSPIAEPTGSFVYVAFVAAMTMGRWFGPRVLDRHGRVPVMRASALCSMVGVLIVVFGPNLGTALFGIVMWGLGTALGFPTGMSAAADEPALAANRVSAVATIGYAAFLAGPSLIGVVGDHSGVRRALVLTAVVLALGSLVAGSTRPLPVG